MPFGPSKIAVAPTTSLKVQPSIVMGLVSGTGAVKCFGPSPGSTTACVDEEAFCRFSNDALFPDTASAGTAPRTGSSRALVFDIFAVFGATSAPDLELPITASLHEGCLQCELG